VQTCIIHLIRNTFRLASKRHCDALRCDVKPIYTAVNADAARAALDELADKWGQRYPAIMRLWENSWREFIPFLDYDIEIRQVLSSTNAIESLNAAVEDTATRDGTQAVVLDCETKPFVDVTATRMLNQLAADLQRQGVRLILAGKIGQVRDMVAAVSDHGQTLEYHRTVQEAVNAARAAPTGQHVEEESWGRPSEDRCHSRSGSRSAQSRSSRWYSCSPAVGPRSTARHSSSAG
jgi:anti-anti-sigma regulatory factor